MTTLDSKAEEYADQARTLPEFKNFPLPGIKDNIAEILNMIGRVDTLFSTYTLHDITHVNAMLKILDWLVPSSTQTAMTPAEWLLIVLSIYLHDLGMVVTHEEYSKRKENPHFLEFLNSLEKDSEAGDYLARIEKLSSDEEKQRFFYQEFIRRDHAIRIKEWITGHHSSRWAGRVEIIAKAIADILKPLPSRFKENLAIICESHHQDNLDKLDYFPLYQHYGSHPKETANVQYAAILLRTVDLLHVTKDRTPSVMYRILGLSDPTGLDEWKKQEGTFSVHRKTREFDPKSPDSRTILVSADFVEERPYFALSEYLVYADQQIKQSMHWANTSQKLPDANAYSFPWEIVKGDIRIEGHEPLPMNFELDRGRLLDLLVGHTIYNDPTVVVRELIQNAIDAVRYQYYLQEKSRKTEVEKINKGRVLITWSPEERILAVEDNGIGMDFDVIRYHLMRVGSSFYNTPKFRTEQADFTPISRFGIGILTCFMISDDIEIVTCQKDGGYRIRMTAVKSDYLLKKLEPGNPTLNGLEPHGTRVTIQLRPTINLNNKSILEIIRYWIIVPDCEVIYQEHGKEPQKIGFDRFQDALRDFYATQKGISKSIWDIKTEKYCDGNGGEYNLNFVVERGFNTELDFCRWYSRTDFPAVCIEGIRVSNTLPGMSDSLCAMLSVTGNRKFQTTVSRSNIDKDEEYYKASEICARLFFKHIEYEVDKISKEIGHPLSRASTAARWIYEHLYNSIESDDIAAHLDEMQKNLPRIVIEEVKTVSGEIKTLRKLITEKQLEKNQYVWTIESRIANYLADISRDLGREISLNDFLETIAPDLRKPHITPIIADAQHFQREMLVSFQVQNAEFSKNNQQTLIQWINKKHVAEDQQTELLEIKSQVLSHLVKRSSLDRSYLSSFGDKKVLTSIINSFQIAPIQGDLEDISGIRTRIMTIFKPESKTAIVWRTLISAFNNLINSNNLIDITPIFDTLITFSALYNHSATAFLSRNYRYNDRSDMKSYLSRDWVILAENSNIILKKHLFEEIPREAIYLVEESNNFFDASRYWKDWDRQSY